MALLGEDLGPFSNEPGYKNREEQNLTDEIAREMARNLSINSNDREVFIRLFKYNLENLLLGRNGALDRYYNNKLDKLLPEFYLHFDLKAEDLEIDKNHTANSKLWTIMNNIQKKYDIKSPNRSKMPDHYGKNQEPDNCSESVMGQS